MKPTKEDLVAKKPKTKTFPFSPALTLAVAALTKSFQLELENLLTAEAKSMSLPDGWSADLPKHTWTVPGK